MKEIEFSEEQLGNLQEVAASLFAQSEDPRCYGYRRQLIRPKINWWAVAAFCLLPPVCAAVLAAVLMHLSVPQGAALWTGIGALALFVTLNLKRILICIVQIYQRYAPASIRNKCRFEPSCSQYMILSLRKHGLCKGLCRGIDRLCRCNIHNGGIDEP